VWIAACALRLIPADYRALSWIGLWWLKPLFDRFALQVISSRFFGEPENGLKPLLKGFGSLFWHSLLGDLTWRRFSPRRASALPLRVLEKPKGKLCRRRMKALSRGGINFCGLLSIAGLFAEALLLAGEAVFAVNMIYVFFPNLSWNYYNDLLDIELYAYILFCLNYIIVESMYVCMGFGLYINSRVEVEGWDIEILFRTFTSKIKTGVKAAVLVLVMSGTLCFEARAEELPESEDGFEKIASPTYFPEGFMPAREIPLDDLKEILESKDFGGTEESWTIRYKYPGEMRDSLDLPAWSEDVKETAAQVLRVLAFIVIGGAAIAAFFLLCRRRFPGRLKQKETKSYGNTAKGEGSPEALFEKAALLYSRGELKEAWAACFGGTVAAYARSRGIAFPADATEYGCLALVRQRAGRGEDCGSFADLVRNWVLFAYGGRPPAEGSFGRALEAGKKLLSPDGGGP